MAEPTPIALLFPGQGSQKPGMGKALYESSAAAKRIFDEADASLGYSLSAICFEGTEDDLRQTVRTQPALYTSSCAALEALRERGTVEPFAVAGHSVGEYAALYAAGSFDFATGLKLVSRRAELMQQTGEARPGSMMAVLGADANVVRQACDDAKSAGVVGVANYNCPGQVVISGEPVALERAAELLKERGASRVLPLNVSGAFHSPLMVSAGDALYPTLRDAIMKQAKVPVVMNVSAEYCRSGVDFAPLLTMQVSSSVRWEQSMRVLLEDGVRTFIELGSGNVLAGLMKRIDKEARVISVQDPGTLDQAVELLAEA
jgi:[acyl-carrier-protein] S-malonyltransferase